MSDNPELAKLELEDKIGKDGLKTFTFRDTGETVLIRHVSPLLGMKLQARHKPPSPPSQEVNYGTDDEPHWVQEENLSHPDYQRALAEHNAEIEDMAQRLMIKRGVHITMTPEKKAQVKELRDFMQDEFGQDLDDDDKMVYVKYIAIGTPEDMSELMAAITRRSRPTEEAVDESTNGFQG